MAHRKHTATRELPLDHQRLCEHCGRTFPVYYRAYAEGVASKSVLPGSDFMRHVIVGTPLGAADRAQYDALVAAFDVLKDRVHLRHLQRCTHCGKYDNPSLEWMLRSYGGYRRACFFQIGVVGVCCLLALLFGLLGGDVRDKAAMTLLLLPSAALVFVATWLLKRPLSPLRFQQQVNQSNDSDRSQRWLKRWNSKAPALIEGLRTCTSFELRRGLWGTLKGLQCFLEPKHGPTEDKSLLPPIHECVNVWDQCDIVPNAAEKATAAIQPAAVADSANPLPTPATEPCKPKSVACPKCQTPMPVADFVCKQCGHAQWSIMITLLLACLALVGIGVFVCHSGFWRWTCVVPGVLIGWWIVPEIIKTLRM